MYFHKKSIPVAAADVDGTGEAESENGSGEPKGEKGGGDGDRDDDDDDDDDGNDDIDVDCFLDLLSALSALSFSLSCFFKFDFRNLGSMLIFLHRILLCMLVDCAKSWP
jgi:hypothetical protein